ncbi:ribosomal RNA processing protein, partial [Coniosporium uncinatum]
MAGIMKRKHNDYSADAVRTQKEKSTKKRKSEPIDTPVQTKQDSVEEEDRTSNRDEEDEDEDEEEEEDAEGDALANTDDDKPVSEATPVKSFAELGIIEPLCEACAALGYRNPTPIQEQSIPIALEGRDIIGLAETGSGKTAAFALPILQQLMDKPQPLFGLVLAPTRELAVQIAQQFEALGSLIAVKVAVLLGGMDMVPQSIALSKKPHIIVATPGRLLDHLENTKGFSLRTLKYLVMDEADRLLSMDFGDAIDKILKVLPRETRRTSLFSATMTKDVESLQRASLRNPIRVSISKTSHQTVKTLLQSWLLIPQKNKDLYLIHLLNDLTGHPTIVFSRTVHETQRLAFLLRALGFGAIPLHGQLSQSARLGALNKFKAKSRDILVATDVAARGLDIPSVDCVINYDLPGESKT